MSETQTIETPVHEVVTETYTRKPFVVEAVRVTEENREALAAWCDGTIEQVPNGSTYIQVKVARALSERQTRAFVGDWILKTTGDTPSFKVYTAYAFSNTFVRTDA
jgi:hypothetical protein